MIYSDSDIPIAEATLFSSGVNTCEKELCLEGVVETIVEVASLFASSSARSSALAFSIIACSSVLLLKP